jgi:hypothetical protein
MTTRKKTAAEPTVTTPEPTPTPVAARKKQVHPKVAAAGIAGAVTTIVVTAATLLGFDMSPEVAAALATIIAFGAGYIKTGTSV